MMRDPEGVPFDVPTWTEHLNAKDPLALVIRGHLYAESALVRHIESRLADKKVLEVSRLQFGMKMKLAAALGGIGPDDIGVLEKLNDLRNKFAHNLETQLTDKDELDLYNTLTPKQRKIVDLMRKPELPFLGKLRCDLMGIILTLQGVPIFVPPYKQVNGRLVRGR